MVRRFGQLSGYANLGGDNAGTSKIWPSDAILPRTRIVLLLWQEIVLKSRKIYESAANFLRVTEVWLLSCFPTNVTALTRSRKSLCYDFFRNPPHGYN